jgi:cell division protein FtsW (lipid II flippase)
MEKGLFIMIVIFLLVGLAHFLSHRLEKISTKSKLRKLFWYFYGGYFLFYGIFRNVEDNWNVLGIIFILIGLLVLLLNFLGKIETRSNLD